jgi:hypothetical protein
MPCRAWNENRPCIARVGVSCGQCPEHYQLTQFREECPDAIPPLAQRAHRRLFVIVLAGLIVIILAFGLVGVWV